eukprot:CAMPEP_0115449894 /NCGR_PEP_ID=MMETSP0271-20121206/41251_1 /TAXON_ID=71861 /ORGANISM="Scrippsiella trochoidea, Strain CCMP3099" /LENGTH=60 /DNA_ID=CAMNT_0002876079 /DNA_START=124 /DNA_END=303 /DNA_ORIENTATION=-
MVVVTVVVSAVVVISVLELKKVVESRTIGLVASSFTASAVVVVTVVVTAVVAASVLETKV